MNNAQRYAVRYVNGVHVMVEPDPKGGWVSYADFAALEAENRRLREALLAIKDAMPGTDDAASRVQRIVSDALLAAREQR